MKTTRSKDGTTLAYDVYGSGPALLYITGASCYRSFKPIVQDAKVFATEFTVYSYDRRGRGDSGNTLLALEAALLLGSKVQKVVMYDASYVHDEKEKAEYKHLKACCLFFRTFSSNLLLINISDAFDH